MAMNRFKGSFSELTASRIASDLNDGDIYYCEEDQKCYMRQNGDWVALEFNSDQTSIEMTAYEMNQSIMSQLPELTEEQLNDNIKLINDFCSERKGKYFMLLNNELRYYTIFTKTIFEQVDPELAVRPSADYQTVGEGVIDCLRTFGIDNFISIDIIDDHIEVWGKVGINLPECWVFFDYTNGVVTYEE